MRMLAGAAWAFFGVVACSVGNDPVGRDGDTQGPGLDWQQREFADSTAMAAVPGPTHGSHDMQLSRCGGGAIDQAYEIVPTVVCRGSRCAVEPHCTTHADCSERAFGRCTGATSATCVYPDTEPGRACGTDADCQPLGRCIDPGLGSNMFCYPTGECLPPSDRRCFYEETPCENDGQCAALPGGVCRKAILFPRCEYFSCFEDIDCGAFERCACGRCVQSTCKTDEECGAGQRCQAALNCEGHPYAFHCSTDADECERPADCPGGACDFNRTSWQCGQLVCGE